MKFIITNGLNKISIRLSEIGNYFSYNKPLATVWNDCRGSIGQYLCILPYNKEYRDEIRNKILDNLNFDYTNKVEELHELLCPVFKLFTGGEYSLNFYHSLNSKYFEYTTWINHIPTLNKYYWELEFSEPIDLKTIVEKENEYQSVMEERKVKGQITWDIVDFSTSSLYDAHNKVFIATQPKFLISEERVKYFESQINQGERPFAIIINSHFNQIEMNSDNSVTNCSLDSANYVLDGHHKLLAYHNLGINPSIAEITHYPAKRDEVSYNIEELIDYLYPWQISHILDNWYEKDKYISQYLQNPRSKIHNFIKTTDLGNI